MNAVGNIPQLSAIPAAPKVSVPVLSGAVPAAAREPVQVKEPVELPSFEQQRFERVQKAAEQIANVHVLGAQTFTMFKDATGQVVTRFRNTLNGQVTYIPEPELLKRSGPLVDQLA